MAAVIAVPNDNDWLMIAGTATALVSLALLFVSAVAAFIVRRNVIGAVSLVAFFVSLGIAFMAIILVGAGQHHPPAVGPEIPVDWNTDYRYGDTEDCALLGTDIEAGSWWTDGTVRYRAGKMRDSLIYMEGGTLHEGGYTCTLRVCGDTLRTALDKNGNNALSEEGRLVTHYAITDGRGEQIEVLVVYDADDLRPQAVLQRFDGKLLDLGLEYMHSLLAGEYAGNPAPSQRKWTFTPDGKMKLSPDAEAKPYKVEMAYDSPTNILRLPDGKRVSVEIYKDALVVRQAHYDKVEEFWTAPTETPGDTLRRQGNAVNLLESRLFLAGPIFTLITEQQANDYYDSLGNGSAIACLNAPLLKKWLDEWKNEEEENDSAD